MEKIRIQCNFLWWFLHVYSRFLGSETFERSNSEDSSNHLSNPNLQKHQPAGIPTESARVGPVPGPVSGAAEVMVAALIVRKPLDPPQFISRDRHGQKTSLHGIHLGEFLQASSTMRGMGSTFAQALIVDHHHGASLCSCTMICHDFPIHFELRSLTHPQVARVATEQKAWSRPLDAWWLGLNPNYHESTGNNKIRGRLEQKEHLKQKNDNN